jgi:hypothetical protein
MAAPPSLPTPEALEAFWSKLADVNEELSNLVRPVFQVANYEGEQQVTYADVGALLVFARDIRLLASDIESTIEKIETVTFHDLDMIRENGRQVNIPAYNEYGGATDERPIIAKVLAEAANNG